MMMIGLTGGIASGKSLATSWLKEKGVAVIDADELSRNVVQKDSLGLKKVVSVFGDGILQKNGELDRKALGQIVFNDPTLLAKLEHILHPLIEALRVQEIERLKKLGTPFLVYAVPILFEKGIERSMDKTILITAPLEERIRRIMQRDGLSRKEAQYRIDAQWPDERKVPLADAVIANDSTIENFHKNLSAAYFRLIKSE